MAHSSRFARGLFPALVLALVACGPSAGTREGKATPAVRKADPCALLTPADAQAALGEPVGQLQMTSVLDDARNSSGDPTQCGYGAESDPARVVRLQLREAADAERAEGAFESARSVLAGAGVRDVPGLGDGAFWAGGAVRQLHVRKGSSVIVVTCDPGAGRDALAIARRVAGGALRRLR